MHMDAREDLLVELGLTDTEARLYLCGLELPWIGVQELVQKTGIKRPTVYHALSTLEVKGLVAERRADGKLYFVMAEPREITRLLDDARDKLDARTKEAERLIPLLENTRSRFRSDTGIAEYHGIEGMKSVMDAAF